MTNPDALIQDIHDGLEGKRDTDVISAFWTIIEDILDTVDLAWQNQAESGGDDLPDVVRDYVTNHYGDL